MEITPALMDVIAARNALCGTAAPTSNPAVVASKVVEAAMSRACATAPGITQRQLMVIASAILLKQVEDIDTDLALTHADQPRLKAVA
jgi:hypothetical protein